MSMRQVTMVALLKDKEQGSPGTEATRQEVGWKL